MAVVRLAKLEDYQSFDLLGRTMYRVTWCEKLCPGNPTDNPDTGLIEFNEWQCSVAAGHDSVADPAAKLNLIVSWCLSDTGPTSRTIAATIVDKYKNPGITITLDFDTSELMEPGLAYRYELAFLNNEVPNLTANQIMQLQNLTQVSK